MVSANSAVIVKAELVVVVSTNQTMRTCVFVPFSIEALSGEETLTVQAQPQPHASHQTRNQNCPSALTRSLVGTQVDVDWPSLVAPARRVHPKATQENAGSAI